MNGHFERTYDGVTWEQISEREVRDRLTGYYIDVSLLLDTMRSHPEVQPNTIGAFYRFVPQLSTNMKGE